MGGDSRPDHHNDVQKQPDASQQLLDQLNHKLTQDAGNPNGARDNPGSGVAPLTDNLGQKPVSSDPFYHGGVQRPSRGHYGVSGTLAPGGAGSDPNRNVDQPGNFQQTHQDQARNPATPYERNTMGVPQQPGQAGAAMSPSDIIAARSQHDMAMRGQHMDKLGVALGGGAGSVLAPYTSKLLGKGAERFAAAPEGSWRNKAGTYWQNNYDPEKVGKADLIKAGEHKKADEGFARMVQTEEKAVRDATTPDAKALAEKRLQLLNREMTHNNLADLKAASSVRPEGPLFNEAEMATIDGKFAANNFRLSAQETAINKFHLFPKTPFTTALKAGVIGTMIDTGLVGIDRMIGKAIGGEKSVEHSWNTEQILAPTALALAETMVGKNPWAKGAFIAGTVGVSRVVDGVSQSFGLGAPTKWNAASGVMNWMDGFGVASGLAIAATAKDPYAKAIAVGVGYALPKAYHVWEDSKASNLANTYSSLNDEIKADHKDRSYSSMENVVDGSKDLNKKQEDWLVGKIEGNRDTVTKNWNTMGTDQKLLAFRDDAAMSKALSEQLLEKGTRFNKDGKPEYTLGGYQMDLGGRAMLYLVSGKDSLNRATDLTQGIIANNNDPTKTQILVDGSRPTQSEVDGLNKEKADYQKDLNKILTQHHDIRGVINQVAKDIPSSSDDWRQTYIKPTDGLIEHYFARKAPGESAETAQLIGKLYRDQAVAYLAYAKDALERGQDGGKILTLLQDTPNNHNDIFPSGRPKPYNGAEGALAMAVRFDPNNKDLADIQDVLNELLPKAQTAAGQQMTGPLNILNVNGQHPH